jgi:hypothetical protein
MTLETIITVYNIASSVVGTAAVIAAATPTPKDDTVLSIIRKALDFIGFNIGFAKNR